MRIAGFGNSSAAKLWRVKHPLDILRKVYGWNTFSYDCAITEDIVLSNDLFLLQGIVDKNALAMLYAYQQERGKKIVVDIDDYLEVNEDNPHKIEHEIADAIPTIKKTLEIADLVTTTNKNLEKYLLQFNDNVAILPNYMNMEFWHKPTYQNTSNNLRVGWAGSMTHYDDVAMLAEPLRQLKHDFPSVEFIILGDLRFKDIFPFAEVMLGVPYDVWPSKLHGLRLDVGLAPLRDTVFNRCKTEIKWMEYGIAHIAGIYSPTVYKKHVHNRYGFIARTKNEWYNNIRNMIISPALRIDVQEDCYRNVVRYYSLEDHIYKWKEAYECI